MQFLADMGISMRVVEWLRLQSHDVVHLRYRGLQRLPNGDIFQLALQEKRIVGAGSHCRCRGITPSHSEIAYRQLALVANFNTFPLARSGNLDKVD